MDLFISISTLIFAAIAATIVRKFLALGEGKLAQFFTVLLGISIIGFVQALLYISFDVRPMLSSVNRRYQDENPMDGLISIGLFALVLAGICLVIILVKRWRNSKRTTSR